MSRTYTPDPALNGPFTNPEKVRQAISHALGFGERAQVDLGYRTYEVASLDEVTLQASDTGGGDRVVVSDDENRQKPLVPEAVDRVQAVLPS